MENCKQKFVDYLSFLPSEWRDSLADVLCKYIVNGNALIDCDIVKECETVTTLSDFTINGTTVSITFTDEHGVVVTRTFDFKDIINKELDSIDPKCLATVQDWNNLSYTQRWQLIVDKVCADCESVVGDLGSTTTTTTTEAPIDLNDCITYIVTNNTAVDQGVTYLRCEGGTFPHSLLTPGQSASYCAVRNSLSAGDCDVIAGEACVLALTPTTTTTSAPTTTTTTVPTTTTTTTVPVTTTTTTSVSTCVTYRVLTQIGGASLEWTDCGGSPQGVSEPGTGVEIVMCTIDGIYNQTLGDPVQVVDTVEGYCV